MIATLGLFGACSGAGVEGATASATSPQRPSTSTASDAAPAAPTNDTGVPDDWAPPPLDWVDCDLPRNGRCASLEVPLDWDDPDGPTILLRLGRVLAEGNRIGSLLINPGGPGGSGLEFLSLRPGQPPTGRPVRPGELGPARRRRLDRGAGAATRSTRCSPRTPTPTTPPSSPHSTRPPPRCPPSAPRRMPTCCAHLGTDDVARDMEAIRRALGDESAQLPGLLLRHPDRPDSMPRCSPSGSGRWCSTASSTPSLGFTGVPPGPERSVRGRVRSRRRGHVPRPAPRAAAWRTWAPPTTGSRQGSSGDRCPAGDRPVGPSELATAAIQTSYGPDGWRDLGPALAAALDGDGGPLWELAAAYYDFGGFTSYAAVVCIDSPPPAGADGLPGVRRRSPGASPRASVVASPTSCCQLRDLARVPPVGDAAPVTAAGAPPILVVGNTGDAATPYENAVDRRRPRSAPRCC